MPPARVGLVGVARAGVVDERVAMRLARRRRAPARRRARSCGTCRARAAPVERRTAAGARRSPAPAPARRAARRASATPTSADRHRPRRRRVLLPGRRGRRGERIERHHQRREHRVRRPATARRAAATIARERQRHDGERDDGNRERVGDRRDQRHLLEQRERPGHQRRRSRRPACARAARRCARGTRARVEAGGGDDSRPAPAYSSTPTAPNDSQKPGVEPGPRIPREHRDERPQPDRRRRCPGRASTSPTAATASISSVRTAGTCAPASST